LSVFLRSSLIAAATVAALLTALPAKADPPPESGIVTREGRTVGARISDENSGLQLILGFNPAEICFGSTTLYKLEVAVPSDLYRFVEVFGGFVPAYVYDFTGIDCIRYQTETPLASGMAHIQFTDNDVEQGGAKNANVYGFTATGALYGPTGEVRTLTAMERKLALKGKTETVVLFIELH
jgi:hypothetical protein